MKPLVLPCLALALALSACGGGGYDTAIAPPTGEETYAATFPTEIGGTAAEISRLELDPALYGGATATYGSGASLTILRVQTEEAMDAYVNDRLLPRLESYSTRSSGKFNGAWSLRGKGKNGRLYGWQNRAWLFVIEAANDAIFDEAVEKHPYISKK